jgi:biotin operon repressor
MTSNDYLESVGGTTWPDPSHHADSFRDYIIDLFSVHTGVTIARTIYTQALHACGHIALPYCPEDIVARVIALVQQATNPRLEIEALAYAAGLYRNANISGEQVARKLGLSRQAFNKRVLAIQDSLGLHATRAQKRHDARKIYSLTNRRNCSYEK